MVAAPGGQRSWATVHRCTSAYAAAVDRTVRTARLAHAFWPRWYRALSWLDPLIERAWVRAGIGNVVRLTVTGRRSGQPRSVFLGLLRVGDRRYLGHPDIACAWTRNLEAAGEGILEGRTGQRTPFRAVLLAPGPERDAVVRATFHQHPFPGNVLYWLLRTHVAASGRFYRLEAPGSATTAEATDPASTASRS